MAWNVVIAGGGVGGTCAARELERLLPKQSARLVLVNDVNFLLYTPFLPEAAAGTLEPRHVVTPLRYRNKGQFVNLGRYKAVGMLGRRTFSGFPAWWMARTYHLSQIPGAARKVRAVVDWTVGLPFRRDIAEVGSIGHPRPLRAEEYARGGTHRPVG